MNTPPKREPTHVTADQLVDMHEDCFTQADLNRMVRRSLDISGNLYIPKDMTPICAHPKHGWCGHRAPSDEQLAEINERLGAKERAKEPGFSYYCLKCEEWHLDEPEDAQYTAHIEFKRKAGRPKKNE